MVQGRHLSTYRHAPYFFHFAVLIIIIAIIKLLRIISSIEHLNRNDSQSAVWAYDHVFFDDKLIQKMKFSVNVRTGIYFSDFQFSENESIQQWISLVIEYSRSTILVQTFQTSIKNKPLLCLVFNLT